jgi:hypothetical protein
MVADVRLEEQISFILVAKWVLLLPIKRLVDGVLDDLGFNRVKDRRPDNPQHTSINKVVSQSRCLHTV